MLINFELRKDFNSLPNSDLSITFMMKYEFMWQMNMQMRNIPECVWNISKIREYYFDFLFNSSAKEYASNPFRIGSKSIELSDCAKEQLNNWTALANE